MAFEVSAVTILILLLNIKNMNVSSPITDAVRSDSFDKVTSVFLDTTDTIKDSRGVIILVNAVLLALCICIAVFVTIRKCKQEIDRKASRNRNTRNVHRNMNVEYPPNQPNRTDRGSNAGPWEVHHNIHRNLNVESAPNLLENRTVRESYAEPWELRHNIVHMTDVYHSTNSNAELPLSDDTDV